MRIPLDSFADMLGIRPGKVIHALRTSGKIDGLELPGSLRQQIYESDPGGSRPSLNVPLEESLDFVQKWNQRN